MHNESFTIHVVRENQFPKLIEKYSSLWHIDEILDQHKNWFLGVGKMSKHNWFYISRQKNIDLEQVENSLGR